MPLNVRFDNDLVILSNFSRLLDDPRHFDAIRDVADLLDAGHRRFVLDLSGVPELGEVGLGLLMTLSRRIRKEGAEVVLLNPNRKVETYLDLMRMDTYWEWFESVEEAGRSFGPGPGPS